MSLLFDIFSLFTCVILKYTLYLQRVIENNATKFAKTQVFLKFNN